MSRWGAPKRFVADLEGALSSTEGRIWMTRLGTEMHPKPTGNIGAAIVERHNELMRGMLHRIADQCKEEGFPASAAAILAEAAFAKNTRCFVHMAIPRMKP